MSRLRGDAAGEVNERIAAEAMATTRAAGTACSSLKSRGGIRRVPVPLQGHPGD